MVLKIPVHIDATMRHVTPENR